MEYTVKGMLEGISSAIKEIREKYEIEYPDYYGPDFFSALDMVESVIDDYKQFK